jgi:hypothetical protein
MFIRRRLSTVEARFNPFPIPTSFPNHQKEWQMSISAASPGERPIGDQKRMAGGGNVPTARRLIPKADSALVPEPR